MILFILSFFAMGVAGGFSHCIGMCHPFVLYIATKYPNDGYKLLIPQLKYNLGRTVTYTFLGMAAGFLGGNLLMSDARNWLKVGAGVFLIIFALFTLFGKHIPLPPKIAQLFQKVKLPKSPFLIGIVLGFIPCGILYGAIAASIANGDVISSALAMTAFGVGTAVALLVLSVFGGLTLKYINKAKWIFAALMIYMGSKFIYKGLKALGYFANM